MEDDSEGYNSAEEPVVPGSILDFKWKREARFYKIKWIGDEAEVITWEDAEDIEPMFPALVEKYWAGIDTRRDSKARTQSIKSNELALAAVTAAEAAEAAEAEATAAAATKQSSDEYISAEDSDYRPADESAGEGSSIADNDTSMSDDESKQSEDESEQDNNLNSQPSANVWETVRSIDGMDKTVEGNVRVYVRWRDGRKTVHPLSVVKRRCSKKLLAFYERHLQIQGITLPD